MDKQYGINNDTCPLGLILESDLQSDYRKKYDMPLRAFIENIEIISTYLMSNEWIELKDRIKQDSLDVIISQTNKKGYLRTSKNGLQHFVHKKGEVPDGYKTESPQLLFIKSQILLGCREAGWDAVSEHDENEWTAGLLMF
ncbi:MAG: hypothetical protein KAR40_16285 [Candidatus Sabulitectum sp.]|nr:hypothetical protein [Candidatus Sabulitectum sp.]